jgi:pyridoxal 5'-phosphate synthase pdxT subunit
LFDKKTSHLTVGVLALQGDFERHLTSLKKVGAKASEVRSVDDFSQLDALIIPGGESTTMALLLREFDMWSALRTFSETKPVWGTCAGLILLSSAIVSDQGAPDKTVEPLGVLDVAVCRNAYGRQINSFEDKVEIIDGVNRLVAPVSFIRAPKITRVGARVEVLAKTAGTPTLVRQNNLLACSFHTELHQDTAFVSYFLNQVTNGNLSVNRQKDVPGEESRSREVA